jgi:hypothetical protein
MILQKQSAEFVKKKISRISCGFSCRKMIPAGFTAETNFLRNTLPNYLRIIAGMFTAVFSLIFCRKFRRKVSYGFENRRKQLPTKVLAGNPNPQETFLRIFCPNPQEIGRFLVVNALLLNVRRHQCNTVASPSCTSCSSPILNILCCLRDCLHSRELCLRLVGAQS